METLRSTYYFETKAQAKRFRSEMRQCFILTEYASDYAVRIFDFERIKEDKKKEVSSLAQKVYREIMK